MKRASFLLFAILFCSSTGFAFQDIDHALVIKNLTAKTMEKGREIYTKSCVTCHGADGTASLPQARSFNKDPLRFGNKPYDMWKTLTNGAGMMASQTWLSPEERYYVIQFIREEFIKKANPKQYFQVTDAYLAQLPKSDKNTGAQLTEVKAEALKGSLKYGQDWFMHNQSDYGYAIHSPLKGLATSVVTLRLDHNVHVSYNMLRMGTVAAWQGRLNVSDTKFNRYRGEGEPFVEGKPLTGLDSWQWTYNGELEGLQKTTGKRAPLPEQYLRYFGHYTYGKEVILSYAISGRNILEYPRAITHNNQLVLSQTLQISPGTQAQELCIGQVKDSAATFKEGIMTVGGKFIKGNKVLANNLLVSMATQPDGSLQAIAAGIVSPAPGLSWRVDANHRLLVTFPPSKEAITLEILRTSSKEIGEVKQFGAFLKQKTERKGIPDLSRMVKGGEALWNTKVVTKGEVNASRPHFDTRYFKDKDKTAPEKLVAIPADYPYVVDNIGLPFDNAYNAWVRPTSLDFMSDGRLVLGTYMGDIWMASGVDEGLQKVNWQRIATGLYEPMGIKVVQDQIYVTCRNGIIRLNDLNQDGETDFYEVFHADQDVSAFFHAFNFGLATDSKGNFYYTKPGEYTDNKDPGNLIKVSPDGKTWESLATGFRVNNGLTISPDDRVFVSDNQGNWTPGNKINLVEKGKFYGYVPNLTSMGWSPDGTRFRKEDVVKGVISPAIVPVPESFSPPALWMPQEFDNSPGGGIWSDKSWGSLGNQFIHTSYGTGWLYYFMLHEVEGVTQAAMVALPFQLDAGIQRVAVNPVDKQIYTTGLTGWDDGVSTHYGVLSRVRYTGGKGHILTNAVIKKGGVELTFNFPLEADEAKNLTNYDIAGWNYQWASRYGSAHYSVKKPGTEGEDTFAVKEAVLGADGTTVFLSIPEITPMHTLRVRFKAKGTDGVQVKDAVYMTIHKVPR
jgi:mono/diheme cytochrome c family protein